MRQALDSLRAALTEPDRTMQQRPERAALVREVIAALEKELALRTAGAAGPAGDDEVMPVAWRVKNETPGLHWTYFEQRPNWHYENGYEVEPLYTSPAIEANDAKDAAWVRRIRDTAAHLRDNSLKLAKYPGMADEARARELAALYIDEIASLYEHDPNEIVGHKTFAAEGGGYRHEPLTRAEANVLLAAAEARDKRRKELMPDEESARRMLFDAWHRLKELGWREAMYAPRDEGTEIEVIEVGSTGVHKAVRMMDGWWIPDSGDLWPCTPTLFRTSVSGADVPGEGKKNG